VDDEQGGYLAGAHLAEAGHRQIAFIGGPDSVLQVRERLAGVQRALADAGLPPTALTVLDTAASTWPRAAGPVSSCSGWPRAGGHGRILCQRPAAWAASRR